MKLPRKPRMADFAVWVTAAEPSLGFGPGTFMAAYADDIHAANDLAIESSAIGPAILAFMRYRQRWKGTAKELLANLENNHSDEKTRRRKGWPKTPSFLSQQLERLAPNLRHAGIDFQRTRGSTKAGQRIITLEKIGKTASERTDDPATVDAISDTSDASDGEKHNHSNDGQVFEVTTPEDLPPDLKEEYQERVAILGEEGGIPEEEAHRTALEEMRTRMSADAVQRQPDQVGEPASLGEDWLDEPTGYK